MFGDAKDAAKDGAEKAGDFADAAAQAVRDAASRASAKVSDLSDRAYSQATQAGEYVGGRVQEQPLAALMLAGLVGGVIGALLASSRR
jgi:ElaB/YqjD/DUF883 family membrane-anchored ribosome-binding protein